MFQREGSTFSTCDIKNIYALDSALDWKILTMILYGIAALGLSNYTAAGTNRMLPLGMLVNIYRVLTLCFVAFCLLNIVFFF